mgnify:CR=1 FL=1
MKEGHLRLPAHGECVARDFKPQILTAAVQGAVLMLLLFAMPFRTPAQRTCGTVADIDGNVYQTVRLGKQCWMRENLRVTHYADGTPLKLGAVTDESAPFYYYPGGSSDNVGRYGLLYSWHTALHGAGPTEDEPSGVQGLCPDGWHLPSNFEWMGLEDFLGYKDEYRCGPDVNHVAKAMASLQGWQPDGTPRAPECSIIENPTTNNTSQLNILPAGSFWNGYYGFGTNTGFWTASEGSDVTSPIHYLASANATVEINCTPKAAAYSVRCLKD